MLRFAIHSTKEFTLEELRIAIFAYIISSQNKESLLIEIQENEKEIIEFLHLFTLQYDKIVIQNDNRKYHTSMAMKLLLDKKAFNCFCSNEVLEQDKIKAKKENKPYSYSGFCETISDETKFHCNAPFVVRIKKPLTDITFTDTLQGKLSYAQNQVDSFEILDFEKSPTLNFSLAINDMLYDVSSIIADTKDLNNVPKQIHIRASLGYTKEIQYTHIPMILNDTTLPTVASLIKEGYLPVAIANYLVTLGYTTPCNPDAQVKEIFTLEEAIEWFDRDKISKNAPKFDMAKLNFINREHLQMIDELRLSKILGYSDEDIGKLAKIYLQECHTTKEIKEKIDTIFAPKEILINFKEELMQLKECLKKAPHIDDFENLKKYITEKTTLSEEKLMNPLYYALTGAKNGPNLSEIYPLIKNYLKEIIK